MSELWPAYDINIQAGRCMLRLGSTDEVETVAQVARDGIFPANDKTFVFDWYDDDPLVRARSVIQHDARCVATWDVENWKLPFLVFVGGQPIGVQEVGADEFPVCRVVVTGSWLGLSYQSQGYGKEIRAGALEFAKQIGAVRARTEAAAENTASIKVTRSLGYVDNGVSVAGIRGIAREMLRFHVDLAEWVSPIPVEVSGLDKYREMLNASSLPA